MLMSVVKSVQNNNFHNIVFDVVPYDICQTLNFVQCVPAENEDKLSC